MSYIILLVLLVVVGFSIYRASVQRTLSTRKHQEPSFGLGNGDEFNDLNDKEEWVGPVRYVTQPKSATANAPSKPIDLNDFIIIHLFAEPGKFYGGYELLQALLSCGLRHNNKRDIFHSHATAPGQGPELFSLVSAVEPGIFDLSKISSFSTPGLTLYLQISAVKNPSEALAQMIEAAKDLANHLGGEVFDAKREPLSVEKMAQLQQLVTQKAQVYAD